MMRTANLPQSLPSALPVLRRLRQVLAVFLLFASAAATAEATTFTVGFDTDNNGTTGCTLATANGPVGGIEQVATTVVTTSLTAVTVIRLERQVCAGGTFGAPIIYDNGGWAVGLGNGTGGRAVIESSLPLSLLAPGGTMRAVVISANGAGGQDATAPFAVVVSAAGLAPVVPVPLPPWLVLPLSLLLLGAARWWRRRHPQQTALLLVLLTFAVGSGLVWAAAVLRDGSVGDWAGVAPAVTDAAGDAPVNADIVAVFTQQDSTNLYLRIDADLRKDPPANQAPVVNAGTNQTIMLPAMAALAGTATDDGLPNPPGTLIYAWTKVSGPGTVTFGNATNAATSASFGVAGTYVLRLIASDSVLSGSADVTITVNPVVPGNQPPVINAGANQSITLPAAAALAGTATDDGLPNPPAYLTKAWSLVSGPAVGVIFGNTGALATTASFQVPGTYVLRLSASDGALTSTSDMQVTVSDGAPVLLSIADRTIELGTRFQQLLVATDANVGDTLTYSLPTAPAGAALSPSPLVDWTPTAGQLGSNTFAARVTDTGGQAATTTFHVTVVHTNHPPQLAPQPNVILQVGTAFGRTLQAIDPDAGDVLAFALAPPAGMTLTGAVLNWPTAGKVPGDYAVTVRVTDAAGLFDEKTFTVTLTQAAPNPAAKDDSYEVKVGAVLMVPAAGVLGNDGSPAGKPLSAIKLTDPDRGTLDALRADGGFTYTAPLAFRSAPGLNPVVSWRLGLGNNNRFALAADLNHDGVVDYVSSGYGNFRAWRGSDGSQLWQFDPSITTNADISQCATYINSEQFALGDVTGGGDIYLFASINCDNLGTAGLPDRYFAANASQILPGPKVATQWKSDRLSRPHPGAYATATSPTLPDPPVTPIYAASANGSEPTLAKLVAGGSTKLLTRFLANTSYGYYYDTPNSGHLAYAACRTITGLPADEGRACKATFVIDAATGAIDQVLTAPNDANENTTPRNSPTKQNIPIIADLDGDGQVEIISGGDVWKLVGGVWTLAWQAQFDSTTLGVKRSYEPSSVAVADLDGDGKAEVIFHLLANGVQTGGVYIFDREGTLLRKIPISTNVSGLLSVADVDGDGAPEILVAGDSFLYAYRPDGSLLWAKMLPDITGDVAPAIPPIGSTPHTSESQLYVYDLDLDGVPEAIVQGTRRLFILDGRTGAELWSIDTESDGFFQPGNPILVDADGDGHVDIIVHLSGRWNCSSDGGPVACLGSAMRISGGSNNWAPGPKVQNQLNFRPPATDDTAKILYDGSVRRNFRQQAQLGTVIDPRIAQSTAFTYKATDGMADSPPATVRIDIKPQNRPPVITSTPPTALRSVTPYTRRVYTITATDPDPGDTVHYELVSSTFDTTYFPGPVVDPVTGGVDIYSGPCGSFGGPCDFGRVLVIVGAVDSHGARTEQSFFVDISYVSVAVPNVIGQLLPVARTAIDAAGLTPLVVTELFASQPAGTVIGQDPAAGAANVPRSATVKLTVSKGPQPFVMPFVVGQQLAATNALLAGVGLTVNASTVFSTTIPVGEIMTQSPAAGTELLPATAPPVAMTVSAGGPLPAPIASIVLEPGPGPLLRLAGEELQYRAVAVLDDGTSADVTLSAAWASSLTSAATVNAVGVVKAITSGSTTISASLAGKTGEGTLNVAPRVLGDNTPPTAAITSPDDGGTVIGPTAVVGTASDANFLRYELAIATAGDGTYTVIAEGTTAVTNGTLGTLDPATLVNDLYTLRLTVFDRSEIQSVATRSVQLAGNRKIGLFTLAYQDLNVPAAGIPLTVHRTYDSRDKAQGDFGIGWRLGLQTLRLRTNRVPGTGWVRVVSGPMVRLTPTSEHKVSVTLPDGKVEEFDLVVSPTSNLGSLDFTNVTGYQARPGTLGRLQALGNTSLLIVNGGAEDELVDDASLDTYAPKLYRYTTLDGTQIEISPADGVKKVTDRNGNAVTFGPGGILHSDGRGIVFSRDGKGRIVTITDLNGSVQTYVYDGNGDLVRQTNAVGGVSTYAYDRHHGLIGIRDATGNQGVRNEYDDAGRLVSTTDAAGKTITFTHNPSINEEVVTNRLGNIARLVYDAQGNVARQERMVTINGTPVLAVTTSTFDALGNETSTIDPDGQRTDATFSGALPMSRRIDPTGLDLTTAFAYNANNDVTGATDSGGRSFAFTVGAAGNLTAATVPGYGSSSVTSNAQGLPTERIDALGTSTALSYDPFGRVIREDVLAGATLLRRVETEWDANGNKSSETLYRTIGGVLTAVTARYAYDPANRMIAMTDAAGGVRRFEYDPAGRTTAEVDPLGRRTAHTYDALGQRTRTTYADGTFDDLTYDAEGNAVSITDRVGRTTVYAYDELERLVRTTKPDGAVTQTIYSAGGLVAAMIDARGNRTDFTYDPAGRVLSTALPAVTNGPAGPLVRPQLSQVLNSLGLPVSRTDPNGRVTTFQFDADGRLARSTNPDGSFAQLTWDELGRRTSVTNEEGQTTTFGYDGLGRLVSVGGHAGTMIYAYDEAGNLLTQTDALGRSTRFRYDLLNRLVERQYPGGEIERWAYDVTGNLVARTDSLGRVTTWSYDALNRPTVKTLPGGVVIFTTYRPDGQRASVTDPRGVTSFAYDSAGRLASVTHPTGDVVNYTYDANGNLVSLATPAATQAYSYDALDRLAQVTAPEGATTKAYDLVGNLVQRTASSGVTTEAVFDSRNRPMLLTHKLGAATLQSYAMSWSPANRRTGITERDGSVESYAYDSRGRLAGATRAGTAPFVITDTYDAVGNRTQTVRDGTPTTFAYDVNDRLLSDGTATYTWDVNGNLVSRADGPNTTNYGYDPQGRLIAVSGPGLANQYVFDADGNRVGATTASGTTRFLVDTRNNSGLSQVLEERDGAGNLAARYTVDTALLTMTRAGATRTMLTDPSGSVRALADAAGAITDQYHYDVHGNTLSVGGTTANPYRWRGERVEESGLVDLRARFYSPGQGRFLGRDPAVGGTEAPDSRHRYLYANADPVNNIDPTGLTTLTEVGFVQAMNSLLDYSYLANLAQQACTAKTGADSVGALASGVSQLLGVGFLLAQGMVVANAVLNPDKPGKGGTFDFNYKSTDGGWLPMNFGLRSKAGQYAGYFSIKYQDPSKKTGNVPYGKFEFSLSGPPVSVNVGGGGGMERTLHTFRYCGTVKAGTIKVRADLMGSGSILSGNGTGSTSAALGLTSSLEMSLFYDALKFGWPLISASEGTKGMKVTLFGLYDAVNVEALPN